MPSIDRRQFVRSSSLAIAAGVADLSLLAPLGRAAGDTRIHPNDVTFGPDTDRLLRLLRNTSREQCVQAFVMELKAGLSYRQFLTVLFLAAIENGDPHQVAQIYGAHRISTEARIEERLLPLFWALNRIKQEWDAGGPPNAAVRPLKGTLPGADEAPRVFREALLKSDRAEAERAAVALARDRGARHVMHQLWEFAARNVGDNLGHPAIALANSHRALEAIGWQHAEVALRYVTAYIAGYKGDRTYARNTERLRRAATRLPADWGSSESSKTATLELYELLRTGETDAACDFICSQLFSRQARAGSMWDAIHLAAADTVSRHKIGGSMLGAQIHAATTTNALRYGFNLVDDPGMKLLNLLQAAGVIGDFYVRRVSDEGNLRDINLLHLTPANAPMKSTLRDVFELLPLKSRDHAPGNAEERAASDRACRIAFELLCDPNNHSPFMQTARSFICVKASLDPHDIKYPVAVFEDTHLVSPSWRPHLLASSVHAIHGSKSADAAVLVQLREALK